MGDLTGRELVRVNPTGTIMSGYSDILIEAWREGLPVHLPQLDFWNKNLNGEFFAREEIGGEIIIDKVIQKEELLSIFLAAINDYLKQNRIDLQYTAKQVKLCTNSHYQTIDLIVSGANVLSYNIINGRSRFKNSFSSQLILNYHLQQTQDLKYEFIGRKGTSKLIGDSLLNFIATRKRR